MISTRVGYAGGTTEKPTYKQMGDHTETLEIDFDPSIISFTDILDVFWRIHNPNRGNYRGRQYLSLLLYHNVDQKRTINEKKAELEKDSPEEIRTEIAAYNGFTLAEERHQKYFLKRYPNAIEQMSELFPNKDEFLQATITARLNGFVKGYCRMSDLREEISNWPIDEDSKRILFTSLSNIRW